MRTRSNRLLPTWPKFSSEDHSRPVLSVPICASRPVDFHDKLGSERRILRPDRGSVLVAERDPPASREGAGSPITYACGLSLPYWWRRTYLSVLQAHPAKVAAVSRPWTPIFLLCARPAVAVQEQVLSAQRACSSSSTTSRSRYRRPSPTGRSRRRSASWRARGDMSTGHGPGRGAAHPLARGAQ